jgi:hypothetical protein
MGLKQEILSNRKPKSDSHFEKRGVSCLVTEFQVG